MHAAIWPSPRPSPAAVRVLLTESHFAGEGVRARLRLLLATKHHPATTRRFSRLDINHRNNEPIHPERTQSFRHQHDEQAGTNAKKSPLSPAHDEISAFSQIVEMNEMRLTGVFPPGDHKPLHSLDGFA